MTVLDGMSMRRVPDDYQYWDGQAWTRVNVLRNGTRIPIMSFPTRFPWSRVVPVEWHTRALTGSPL